MTDLTYSYQIAPAKLYQSIRWEEKKHPFFMEMQLKPIRLHISFKEIPADWTARKEGKSQNTFLQNFKYLRIALKVRFEKKAQILKDEKELRL